MSVLIKIVLGFLNAISNDMSCQIIKTSSDIDDMSDIDHAYLMGSQRACSFICSIEIPLFKIIYTLKRVPMEIYHQRIFLCHLALISWSIVHAIEFWVCCFKQLCILTSFRKKSRLGIIKAICYIKVFIIWENATAPSIPVFKDCILYWNYNAHWYGIWELY